MKKNKVLILLAALMLMSTMLFVACTDERRGEPEDDRYVGKAISEATVTVGADYIEFTEIETYKGTQLATAGYYETSRDEVKWSQQLKYEGLEPNTEYDVFVRRKETQESKTGPALKKTATTLKQTLTEAPKTTIIQEDNVVTVVDPNNEFEVTFEYFTPYDAIVPQDEASYTDVKTHTYPVPAGNPRAYAIFVRYKETNQSFSGAKAQRINIHIGGFHAGIGKKNNPYIIKTYEQLQNLQKAIYIPEEDEDGSAQLYVKLLNDITFPEEALTEPMDSKLNSFAIHMDGDGFKLIKPKMNYPKSSDGLNSLFERLSTVSNLTVVDAELITSIHSDGWLPSVAILGDTLLSLMNCHVSGTIVVNVNGKHEYLEDITIGGFSGVANAIENCSSNISISYTSDWNDIQNEPSGVFIGGLAGKATTIKNSFAKVNIVSTTSSGFVTVGGLVGEVASKGVIENCYVTKKDVSSRIAVSATGVRTGQETEVIRLGGLVGHLVGGKVKNVYADIDLSVAGRSINSVIGGVVGVNDIATPQSALENSLYNGKIAANRAGAGYFEYIYTVLAVLGGNATVANSYHNATMPNVGVGTGTGSGNTESQVDNSESIAASEDDLLSAAWQKTNLKFDEKLWEFTDGKLPQLKK